jgi:hypothetical protein
VPVPVGIVDIAGDAGELAAPAGAAPPVWAHAEIVKRTAMARIDRRNLLVIGSLKLLGTLVPVNMVSGKDGSGNELRLSFSGNAGPYSRGLRPVFLATAAVRRHQTRRTGLPASHAGVADVSSTPDQLSTMAWIPSIIESRLSRRQTPTLPHLLRKSSLESRRHRKPERLARLPQ